MAANPVPKKKPETRNLALYKDDFEWFDRAADYADRSRIRMMRYVISQWKLGQPVLLTVNNLKRAK